MAFVDTNHPLVHTAPHVAAPKFVSPWAPPKSNSNWFGQAWDWTKNTWSAIGHGPVGKTVGAIIRHPAAIEVWRLAKIAGKWFPVGDAALAGWQAFGTAGEFIGGKIGGPRGAAIGKTIGHVVGATLLAGAAAVVVFIGGAAAAAVGTAALIGSGISLALVVGKDLNNNISVPGRKAQYDYIMRHGGAHASIGTVLTADLVGRKAEFVATGHMLAEAGRHPWDAAKHVWSLVMDQALSFTPLTREFWSDVQTGVPTHAQPQAAAARPASTPVKAPSAAAKTANVVTKPQAAVSARPSVQSTPAVHTPVIAARTSTPATTHPSHVDAVHSLQRQSTSAAHHPGHSRHHHHHHHHRHHVHESSANRYAALVPTTIQVAEVPRVVALQQMDVSPKFAPSQLASLKLFHARGIQDTTPNQASAAKPVGRPQRSGTGFDTLTV